MHFGYLLVDGDTALDTTLLLRALRALPGLPTCVLGYSAMCADPDTWLADTQDASGVVEVTKLLDSALFLSPSRALIITGTAHALWEVRLAVVSQRTPSSCVQRLRWRPSCRSGRTWVKPPLLDRDLRAARVRAIPGGPTTDDFSDRPAGLLVTCRGPLGDDSDNLLAIMEKVGLVLRP